MKKKSIRLLPVLLCFALALSACHAVSEEPPENNKNNYELDEGGEFVSPVYAALSDEEKAVYDKVKEAVASFEDAVSFDPPVPKETVRKIYKLVYSQERKYFWLSNLFYAPFDEISVYRLDYLYEREDAELKRAELDLAVSTVLGELPEGVSDFDKAVYFHDRVVTGCSFSSAMEHVNSAYGVLVTGYGQCEGYAAAYSALCDKAGIPNYVVTGTSESGESHAWNKVLLDGEWYNVDCTWDDPILKRDSPDFVRHDYLLVKDSEIEGITHFPDSTLFSGLPPCEGDELNYFRGKGLMFDSASDGLEAFAEQVKAAGLSGRREAEVRFSGENAYFTAMARLFDSGEVKSIIEDINGSCGTHIRSAYKHNNDEMFIVHISLIFESDPEEQA